MGLDDDVRLDLLYRILTRLRALTRNDRPTHRFFAPLLGRGVSAAPRLQREGGSGIVLAGRGIVVRRVRDMLVVHRDCPVGDSWVSSNGAPGAGSA
jgi:hypothetical protein